MQEESYHPIQSGEDHSLKPEMIIQLISPLIFEESMQFQKLWLKQGEGSSVRNIIALQVYFPLQ